MIEKIDFSGNTKKKYTKKYEQETNRNRKKELAMADTPCLEYYYDAIQLCSTRGKICYSQLMRTYTLRSRYEFDCLDASERISNFKTPTKNISVSQSVQEISTTSLRKKRGRPKKSTTARTKDRADKRKQDEVDGAPKRYGKRPMILAPCDMRDGLSYKCRYCKLDIISNQSESHLLYHCKGIPNSDPLPKSNRSYPKGLMKRLAEIGAVPDPGGAIL